MGSQVGIGFIFFVLGIIFMALAGDANGVAFFLGIALFFIGIMIWLFSGVWSMAGIIDNKTREWINDDRS